MKGWLILPRIRGVLSLLAIVEELFTHHCDFFPQNRRVIKNALLRNDWASGRLNRVGRRGLQTELILHPQLVLGQASPDILIILKRTGLNHRPVGRGKDAADRLSDPGIACSAPRTLRLNSFGGGYWPRRTFPNTRRALCPEKGGLSAIILYNVAPRLLTSLASVNGTSPAACQ